MDSTMLFRFRIVIGTPRRTKESTCEQSYRDKIIQRRENNCGILLFASYER